MKAGRNSPCPCGSGRKYKRCCLEKAEGSQAHLFAAKDDELLDREQDGDEQGPEAAETARMMTVLVATGGEEALTPRMVESLTRNFDLLPHFLDGFLAIAHQPSDDISAQIADALQYLLQLQLTNLRYNLEAG